MFISKESLNNKVESRYHEGVKEGLNRGKKHVKELEREVESMQDRLYALERSSSRREAELESHIDILEDLNAALEDERTEYQATVAQRLENEDLKSQLKAQKGILGSREAALGEREALIGSKEEGNYKKGYADGLSDGLRKIGEITQKDRDNAMKIALVSASSHTPIDNLKEINSVHQITPGNSDK